MRGSIIVYGSTQESRQAKTLGILETELQQRLIWSQLINFPDIFIIEPQESKKSIGIAQIKGGIAFLQERPLALSIKILIIDRSELMTIDSQNALLKTLEEPSDYALIVLLSKTENALLPTASSRCRKFKATPQVEEGTEVKNEWTLKYVLNLTKGERLDWAEEISKEEREDVIEILENWLTEGRLLIGEAGDAKVAIALEKITEITNDLENTNVGTRFAVENLVLAI